MKRVLQLQKIGLALLATAWIAQAHAQRASTITVASTTSTEQSGLFGYLLPRFTEATNIGVKVVAVGTGQALDIGRRGDADVLFVHDRPAEDKFMAEGQGVKRFDVMYNDFVVVGPKSDPAHIGGDKDVVDALHKIAAAKALFISRGDLAVFVERPISAAFIFLCAALLASQIYLAWRKRDAAAIAAPSPVFES